MLDSGRRPSRASRLRPAWARLGALALLMALLLSACGPAATDEDDRRFADRSQPAVASPVAPGTPIAGPERSLPIAATPDLATLLSAPAAPDSAFFLVGGRLAIVSADGAVEDVSLTGPVTALSVSAGGDLAAVLVAPAAPGATPAATPGQPATPDPSGIRKDQVLSVVIVGPNGESLRTIDNLMALLSTQPEIQDALSGEGAAATVAMGPTADDLLVAFPDGLLVRLPAEGEASVIPGSGNLMDVRQVVWSPDGGSLAIVGADTPGGLPAVFSTALRADGVDPVRIAPGPGRTTGDVAWLPDGRGVVFVDATGPVSAATLRSGRDLFVTPLRSDRRMLVAAAGIIGPAAGVVDFSVNPGGESVAYTLYRVEGDEARFNSLWVSAIDDRAPTQLTLPVGTVPAGLAWTSAGLLVLTAATEDTAAQVLIIGSDGMARPAQELAATPAA